MLEIKNLSRSFGGVKAVDDVTFDIASGTIHSVIGPNGAGKTTLFNLITGVYIPSSGRILFNGRDVTGMRPDQLAGLGMCRTFQNLQICMNMSACENVMLGAHLRLNHGILAGMANLRTLARSDAKCREEAYGFMEFAGVGQYKDAHATQMSFGALKRLEIARALALKPKILLLDEPAAGLNHTETGEISELIKKIAGSGLTVVLVEHDMKMVMNISDRITVLNYGTKLASGTVVEVRQNPAVISAYLGTAAA
ncbi:ABC transporter ATP-binding protein [Eoetvoesiella caeni]|uniref:Amino acid/amide ABC transporter ATP-binding protein 1 (HAAT family) n=1 Tax=Eoetvoesiella caeni TaxID=645616 RepID=A0A366HKX8_9BURK|nr:ABC transporter ATP-binding protein [Eoetvoesiella caeni]MCI2806993.1 ABC transporter ATP-binding protein [Eoetvoesiella caeni]NYT53611.1 ABC transporter ATP-binding protein [Eoetvoesiella caeni]RBP43599.1 amino acid/amide ABC transporter ATP-binding protein 1 (HAAT family) [Eoetvoesiella caeni]